MLFITFIGASILEYLSLLVFCISLFRFNVKEFFAKLVLSSVILSFVSNTMQVESLQDIAPVINVILLLFLVTIILRTRLLHSIIMVVISYVGFSLVQWILYTITIRFGLFESIVTYTKSGFFLQGITAVVMFLISAFLKWQKGGFGYIQSAGRFYKESYKDNKLFLAGLLLGLVVVFGINLFYLTSVEVPTYLYTVALIIIVTLVVLLYFSVRKDDRT